MLSYIVRCCNALSYRPTMLLAWAGLYHITPLLISHAACSLCCTSWCHCSACGHAPKPPLPGSTERVVTWCVPRCMPDACPDATRWCSHRYNGTTKGDILRSFPSPCPGPFSFVTCLFVCLFVCLFARGPVVAGSPVPCEGLGALEWLRDPRYIHVYIYIYIYIYISRGWPPVVPRFLAYYMMKKVFSPAREYMFWKTGALM